MAVVASTTLSSSLRLEARCGALSSAATLTPKSLLLHNPLSLLQPRTAVSACRAIKFAVKAQKGDDVALPATEEVGVMPNGVPLALFHKADEEASSKEKKEKKDKKEKATKDEKKEKKEEEEKKERPQFERTMSSGRLLYMSDTDSQEKGESKGKGEKSKALGDAWGDGPVKPTAHYPDDQEAHAKAATKDVKKTKKKAYKKAVNKLKVELVTLQEWIRTQKLRVVVIFEGRDAAGKGGIIKTISEATNPRVVSIKALAKPSDRERTQWYFQRYVAELPAGGEMVLFDRSWYNRAGVERVMGFCSDEEYKEFLRSCPEFERMLVRSGIVVLKYWISVSPQEQERRFKERLSRPEKRWKLSDMDLESRARWSDYSQAKDIMFSYTDIKQAPWFVVPADDKKAARLNCIAHILNQVPYEDIIQPNDLKLPPLQDDHYIRPPITDQTFVEQVY